MIAREITLNIMEKKSKSVKSFTDCVRNAYRVIWQILQNVVRENISRFPIFTVWKASSVIRCLDRRKHRVQLKTIWSPKYLENKQQRCSIREDQKFPLLFLSMRLSFGCTQVLKIRTNLFRFKVSLKQIENKIKNQDSVSRSGEENPKF